MRYRVLPYKQGSASAKALADALGGKVLKLEGSGFKPKADDVVINWGNKTDGHPLLVSPTRNSSVGLVTNKLSFFRLMKNAGVDCIPNFWTKKEDIPDGTKVVCRTVLAGHSGAGIVVGVSPLAVVDAPLYTEYLKKKEEYRVHLGKRSLGDSTTTVAIAIQRKARRIDCPSPNWEIRNHSNGFVYTREGFVVPPCVTDAATRAFVASGLDFGAVDVIYNEQKGKAYVLEINTAPGLEGQTILDYAAFFQNA